MSPRERMMSAMANGKPDRVPVAPDISNMIPARMTGKPFWDIYLHDDPPIWKAYLDAVERLGIDGWFIYADMGYRYPGGRTEAAAEIAEVDGPQGRHVAWHDERPALREGMDLLPRRFAHADAQGREGPRPAVGPGGGVPRPARLARPDAAPRAAESAGRARRLRGARLLPRPAELALRVARRRHREGRGVVRGPARPDPRDPRHAGPDAGRGDGDGARRAARLRHPRRLGDHHPPGAGDRPGAVPAVDQAPHAHGEAGGRHDHAALVRPRARAGPDVLRGDRPRLHQPRGGAAHGRLRPRRDQADLRAPPVVHGQPAHHGRDAVRHAARRCARRPGRRSRRRARTGGSSCPPATSAAATPPTRTSGP